MEKITFKTFCNRLGYTPNGDSGRNLCALAAIIGVHNSYLSKLYSATEITEKNGTAFEAVIDFMASKGYELDYIPNADRTKINKQINKNNIFDVFIQKEYNKLNTKYESLYEKNKELEKKYKALEIAYANTISEAEVNKLKEENKIMKDHLKHLKELFDFINLVGGDL